MLDNFGYELTRNKKHPLARKNGVLAVHRQVWFDAYGEIPKGFVIHHKNEKRNDNRLSNLECLSKAEHMSLHRKSVKIKMLKLKCFWCGKNFIRRKSVFDRNHNKLPRVFCGKICLSRYMHHMKDKYSRLKQ